MGARGNVPAPHLAHLRPRPDAHASRGARRVHPRVRGDGGGDPAEPHGEYEVTFETEGEDEDEDEDALGDETDTARADVPRVSGARRKPRPARHREPREVRHETGAVGGGRGRTRALKTRRRDAEKTSRERRDDDGRAFCFLPLPARTGLPVHVNAYFELSSNRRDIWFGEDMAGGGAARSEWNRALLELVAAPAYARLIVAAKARLGPSRDYYALLPRVTLPRRGARWWRERAPSSATRPCFTPRERRAMGLPRGGDVPRSRDDVRPVVGRGARRRGRLHSGRAGGGARTNGRTRGVVS